MRKYVIIFILVAITVYSCYKVITLETKEEELANCSKYFPYDIIGNYYVITDIDSLDGDEINVSSEGKLTYFDYVGGSRWAIWDKGYIKLNRDGTYVNITSDLDILNGSFYVCQNIMLNTKLNIKFLRK